MLRYSEDGPLPRVMSKMIYWHIVSFGVGAIVLLSWNGRSSMKGFLTIIAPLLIVFGIACFVVGVLETLEEEDYSGFGPILSFVLAGELLVFGTLAWLGAKRDYKVGASSAVLAGALRFIIGAFLFMAGRFFAVGAVIMMLVLQDEYSDAGSRYLYVIVAILVTSGAYLMVTGYRKLTRNSAPGFRHPC